MEETWWEVEVNMKMNLKQLVTLLLKKMDYVDHVVNCYWSVSEGVIL